MKKYSVPALIFDVVSIVCFITSIWAPKPLNLQLIIGGVIFYTITLSFDFLELKEKHLRLTIACKVILDNQRKLYDFINGEEEVPEEEKTTVIVSPEDFERFKKGEMTKEEMLNIKKAVDKVTESKKDV